MTLLNLQVLTVRSAEYTINMISDIQQEIIKLKRRRIFVSLLIAINHRKYWRLPTLSVTPLLSL